MLVVNADRAIAALVIVVTGIAVACGGEGRGSRSLWTVRQAESISMIRGMHVHVLECRGLGHPTRRGGSARFRHFACVAGARRPGESYFPRIDTVGVFYNLRPLDKYEGPASRYTLEHVRFIGGPGIP